MTFLHQRLCRLTNKFLTECVDKSIYNIPAESEALVDWIESDYYDLKKCSDAELTDLIKKTWKAFGKLTKES